MFNISRKINYAILHEKKPNNKLVDGSQLLELYCDNNIIIQLKACAECCSSSKFIININELKYKEIDDIILIDQIESPYNFNNRTITYNYRMKFKNYSEDLLFSIQNDSNGYYVGWLDINIKKSINQPDYS